MKRETTNRPRSSRTFVNKDSVQQDHPEEALRSCFIGPASRLTCGVRWNVSWGLVPWDSRWITIERPYGGVACIVICKRHLDSRSHTHPSGPIRTTVTNSWIA
ncbi:hypothetical protein M407DRAFT_147236 [Tulasnella calospora MUT 4182]|uniref:Uncharacterized protein n=1 Tax=Tulasnella calospora MUT 4182 TaxID=1051891 RepID=A0A0C3Q6M0_9AGAM|nr:hypothetical protein M407DRAFT_147236 [Tulasnella calospora MUT 4182]